MENKISIDINNPDDHLKKLAQYVIAEVVSAGGDGDCTIICKCYDMGDMADLIWKELELLGWQQHWTYDKKERHIVIYDNQEAIIITDDLQYVMPDWAQCIIKI